MIALVESENYPLMYSSILSHFLFEYIHPFYDGNGRTGRFLLAEYLNIPLSLPTVLSLSKTIAEHKGRYYKAFEITENDLNHGEATYFIILIMELIKSAQENLEVSLMEKRRQLDEALVEIKELEKGMILTSAEGSILYGAIQSFLFEVEPSFTISDAADQVELGEQTTRKYIRKLEEKELLVMVSKRPARFSISNKAKEALHLEEV